MESVFTLVAPVYPSDEKVGRNLMPFQASRYPTYGKAIPTNSCLSVQVFERGHRNASARGLLQDSAPGITAPLGAEYVPEPRSGPDRLQRGKG